MNLKKYITFCLTLVTLLTLLMATYAYSSAEIQIDKTLLLKINSTINPATLNYLKSGFDRVQRENIKLILIKINTPGGLVSTTKDILTLFGESDVPVIVWVTPEGASATSAGAIISSGSHFLFMSQGTNIGAATPVSIDGNIGEEPKKDPNDQNDKKDKKDKNDKKDKQDKNDVLDLQGKKPFKMPFSDGGQSSDLRKKAINDLVALVKSLGHTRGRNAELFADMIIKASSFESKEALSKGLINAIANNIDDIFKFINNKEVSIKGQKFLLKTNPNIRVIDQEMDIGQQILDIFANPSLAYILFIIGAALIYLEMQAPGGFIAGSIGAICLLLSGIAFQVLPLNFGSLGLIILSFVFFILETYVTSYGVLMILGIISLTFGSLFLYRSENSYLDFHSSVVYSTVFAIALFVSFISLYWAYDARKRRKGLDRKQSDHHKVIGKNGTIVSCASSTSATSTGTLSNHYQVKISGEIWNCWSKEKIEPGTTVEVIALDADRLTLEVKKIIKL
ncbi:MAG: nodulation protein NfeD [Oligoflexia bacterium]|nr:nodulation protein NfeD [Oligoflexia bacterium]